MTIFSKIVRGEIPCHKVYEDGRFLAFLDIAPANKGHTLVIPKEEYSTFNMMPPELLAEMVKVVQKVSIAIKDGLGADGYNIFVNNHHSAGQVVEHVHFHIVPRYEDDGIRFDWPQRKYDAGEEQEILNKITTFLKG